MSIYSQQNRNYYLLHKEIILKRHKKNKELYPWKRTLTSIKQRCNNPKNKEFKDYGGRGIKCFITSEELKTLWIRDNAHLLKHPSINRKNNNGNYTFENCEFIEIGLNSSERNKRVSIKTVLQFSLDNKFIKEWDSVKKASDSLKIEKGQIANCARKYKYNKTAGGFIWRYR
jgi:hypothetical protein